MRDAPEFDRSDHRERRQQQTFIVSILVAAMTGVGFQEMAAAVGEEFRAGIMVIGTILLAIVVALTTIGFFVGAALHLTSQQLLDAHGFV